MSIDIAGTHISLIGSLTRVARLAALGIAGLALCVIAGHLLHSQSLIHVRQGLQGMSIVTACGILALAVSLAAQSWGHARIGWCGAAFTALLGVGLIAVHAFFGVDTVSPAIEGWLGSATPGEVPARVSLATALCLSGLGMSVVLSSRVVAADVLALGVILVSSFGLMGHAYGAHDLYALPIFATMALHTSISLLALSLVVVLQRPENNWLSIIGSNSQAGASTRRQLTFTLLPPIGGWILLRAMHLHAIGPAAGMAVLVVVTVISLAVLILRDGRRLVELDDERRGKMAVQTSLQEEMKARLLEQERELTLRNEQQSRSEAALYKVQRLDALSQLTGGIAHDFNNLLQAIGGNLDLLGRRLEGTHPARALVDRAKLAMQRGSKLSAQLLAFSKTQRLDIRLIELDSVLTNSQTMLTAALGSSVALVFELQAPKVSVRADENQLQLALLNVVLNAKDALHRKGEVRISSSLLQAALTDGGTAEECVVIRIKDTGHGMPPEVAAKAAEPFYTTKPLGTASGLGLAQVYGFMRQCGGNLRIDTAVGEGTTVELMFAATQGASLPSSVAAGTNAADTHSRSTARRLILVVEDDENVRGVIVEGLKSAGYDVAEAVDGLAGVEMLARVTPSAAVIDFLMPGLNGAQVAEQARLRQPKLPIVFVSGYFDTVALAGIENATMLRKPFKLDELRGSLERALA